MIHLTTNGGLEDLAAAELRAHAAALGIPLGEVVEKPDGRRGRVGFDAAPEDLPALIPGLRAIHHALRPLTRFTLPAEGALAEICAQTAALDFPELHTAGTFRVTASRKGRHAFNSVDVQVEAGAVIVERWGLPVRLKQPDLELRYEIMDERVEVSVQLTHAPLSRRHPRPAPLRTALGANVAWALLTLANRDRPPPAALLDPCVGSGTLLLEAAQLWPEARLFAGDGFEKPAAAARANLADAGIDALVTVADARDIDETFAGQRFDVIVANPPFGVRLGAQIDFREWYIAFLRAAAGVLAPGGRLALLALKRTAFNRALREVPQMGLTHVRIVDIGGLFPGLFVLERRPVE
ncbi:MAG: methyltransferase [Alphaproteobacteria bacterium]|nr:methyltransferase [Alphaproteobacteria bacterium]